MNSFENEMNVKYKGNGITNKTHIQNGSNQIRNFHLKYQKHPKSTTANTYHPNFLIYDLLCSKINPHPRCRKGYATHSTFSYTAISDKWPSFISSGQFIAPCLAISWVPFSQGMHARAIAKPFERIILRKTDGSHAMRCKVVVERLNYCRRACCGNVSHTSRRKCTHTRTSERKRSFCFPFVAVNRFIGCLKPEM